MHVTEKRCTSESSLRGEKVNMHPPQKKKNGRSTDTKVVPPHPYCRFRRIKHIATPPPLSRLPLPPTSTRGLAAQDAVASGRQVTLKQDHHTKAVKHILGGHKHQNGAANSAGKPNGTQPSPWPFLPADSTAQCTPGGDVRAFARTGGRTPSYCSIPVSVPAPCLR